MAFSEEPRRMEESDFKILSFRNDKVRIGVDDKGIFLMRVDIYKIMDIPNGGSTTRVLINEDLGLMIKTRNSLGRSSECATIRKSAIPKLAKIAGWPQRAKSFCRFFNKELPMIERDLTMKPPTKDKTPLTVGEEAEAFADMDRHRTAYDDPLTVDRYAWKLLNFHGKVMRAGVSVDDTVEFLFARKDFLRILELDESSNESDHLMSLSLNRGPTTHIPTFGKKSQVVQKLATLTEMGCLFLVKKNNSSLSNSLWDFIQSEIKPALKKPSARPGGWERWEEALKELDLPKPKGKPAIKENSPQTIEDENSLSEIRFRTNELELRIEEIENRIEEIEGSKGTHDGMSTRDAGAKALLQEIAEMAGRFAGGNTGYKRQSSPLKDLGELDTNIYKFTAKDFVKKYPKFINPKGKGKFITPADVGTMASKIGLKNNITGQCKPEFVQSIRQGKNNFRFVYSERAFPEIYDAFLKDRWRLA